MCCLIFSFRCSFCPPLFLLYVLFLKDVRLLSKNYAFKYVLITMEKLWVRIPLMAKCTRYNIMWKSWSVTCVRSVSSTNETDCHDITEEFEDTKGTIRIRISKKNRQHNGQKEKYKRTNNDILLKVVLSPYPCPLQWKTHCKFSFISTELYILTRGEFFYGW